MKYMNKEKFGNSYLKISEETSDAVKKVASELNLLVEENSDEFIITENKDDNERKIHFTKIGDKVPVGTVLATLLALHKRPNFLFAKNCLGLVARRSAPVVSGALHK